MTVHVNATLPIKPPRGVTVMVEIAGTPTGATLTAVLASVKFGAVVGGGAVTV
jgi:hypothetical protein